MPPKPEMKNEWAGTPFFRPVAIESAVFESMGRTIAIAGAESVPLDESCDYEGVSWSLRGASPHRLPPVAAGAARWYAGCRTRNGR